MATRRDNGCPHKTCDFSRLDHQVMEHHNETCDDWRRYRDSYDERLACLIERILLNRAEDQGFWSEVRNA